LSVGCLRLSSHCTAIYYGPGLPRWVLSYKELSDQADPRAPWKPQNASPPGTIRPTQEANIGIASPSIVIDEL